MLGSMVKALVTNLKNIESWLMSPTQKGTDMLHFQNQIKNY